jgi:class 3 adenylate cyclase/tetratricopeptide (TPR) repeat protein
VLFCDLVGFTAASERRDPEDVSRDLDAYYAAVRREIERFGGVVEKFIGDAVVGVWGAPAEREDDSHRAVLAALAILQKSDADVRIAVNTGEALVKVTARPERGEGFVAGDVVNTAARLQSVAPVGGILVGEHTARRVERLIRLEGLAPVRLKGKSAPVRISKVLGQASPATAERTRLVGRTSELARLFRTLETSLAAPKMGLVTIHGEPGVGKSRLASEFVSSASTSRGLATLHGRCVAYGDGFGLWPLSDIVKGHAGIRDTDTPARAFEKLDQSISGLPDGQWLRSCLARLVGISEQEGDREENFAGLTRLLDWLCSREPHVIILEDLHWADTAVLDFLEHLMAQRLRAPLMVVCTARPEFLDATPRWNHNRPDAYTLQLHPLDDVEMAELASLVISEPRLEGVRRDLVRRANGNPLYAEEFGRLLLERRADAGNSAQIPDSVRALIAARLDSLPLEHKRLIQTASVIGRVFGTEALAAVSERAREYVDEKLHGLSEGRFVVRGASPAIAGDIEYVFTHDLVRDVAYQQLPRNERAARHRRVAEWIEQTAGERIRDRAELIAHHYHTALGFASTTDARSHEHLRRAAMRSSAAAADVAMSVDSERALRHAETGLALVRPAEPERVELLGLASTCLERRGDLDRAEAAMVEAIQAARGTQDAAAEIRASLRLSLFQTTWGLGEEPVGNLAEAAEVGLHVLEDLGDLVGVAEACLALGDAQYFLGQFSAAESAYERAIETGHKANRLRLVASAAGGLASALLEGPTPVDKALERVDTLRHGVDDALTDVRLLAVQGTLNALAGKRDEGWAQVIEGADAAGRIGAQLLGAANFSEAAYVIASADGRLQDASPLVRQAVQLFTAANEQGQLSTRLAYLAHIEHDCGRIDEAEMLARRSADLATGDDYDVQAEWRLAAAKLAASRGDAPRAEQLAERAVAILLETESLIQASRTLEALSQIQEDIGRNTDAVRTREKAFAMHVRKGNRLALARFETAHARV